MPSFVMPNIFVGDMVLWYHAADRTTAPRPAVVTHVGAETIACSVFEKDSVTMRCMDGVRHLDDPTTQIPEAREAGAWTLVMRITEQQQKQKGAFAVAK